MSEIYIHSPQPTRPLKRKACQLYSPEDTIEPEQKKLHLDHEGCEAEHFNRPALYNSNPYPNHPTFDGVRSWLARVPSPLDRRFTRSDSYLVANMPSRTTDNARVADRPATAKPVMQVPLTQAMLPPSPCLTQTPSVPLTPSHSLPPPSQASQTITDSTGTDGSKKLKGVRHPCYRDGLWFHSVRFDPLNLSTPSILRDYVQQILDKERTTPELADAQLVSIWTDIAELMNSDEDATREGFRETALFPRKKDFKNLSVGNNLMFDRTGLPQAEGLQITPIVAPKPDLQYGYTISGFDGVQFQTMTHNRLVPFARPTSASYWPFFAVEFKSASRGGTHWVAENQNSGTGSHCVKSMEKLLSYSRPVEQREIKDSLAFTCTADVNSASIWVHWCDSSNEKPMFISSKITSYSFSKKDELQVFRKSVRNIIDHGLGERLTTIKKALSEAYLRIPQWDAEDKSKRSRKASQMESEYDADRRRWGQESEE